MNRSLEVFRTLALLLAITLLHAGCTHADQSPAAATSAPSSSNATTSATPASGRVEHVDADAAAKRLAATPSVVVLDVRTPDEFAGGHIPGAKNLDFRSPEFASRLEALDRNQTYLVHCAAGGRSKASLATFEKLGFKSVLHLDGGFSGWAEAGKPVAK